MEEATCDDGIVAGVGCTAVREATCNGEGGGATDAGGGAASISAVGDGSVGGCFA